MRNLRSTWSNMIARCTKPKDADYPRYGGRGITVCDRWLVYANFVADVGIPGPELSLDRIDNNKGYEPSNCRWATAAEQQRNRRDNLRVTHNGRTQTATDWALETGLNRRTIGKRLKAGWTAEQALTVKDTRGMHMVGRTRSAETKQRISEAMYRRGKRA